VGTRKRKASAVLSSYDPLKWGVSEIVAGRSWEEQTRRFRSGRGGGLREKGGRGEKQAALPPESHKGKKNTEGRRKNIYLFCL